MNTTPSALPSSTAALPASERPLKIAFLVPEDRQTGTYFRFHNLAVSMRAAGHEVTVYSQTNESRTRIVRETREGVPYVLTPTVPGNRLVMSPVNPLNAWRRRLFTPIASADVYHLFQPYLSAAIPWLGLKRRRRGLFAYDIDDFWINEEFGLKDPRTLQKRWTAKTVAHYEHTLPARAHLTTYLTHPLGELARRCGARRSVLIYNGVRAETPVPRDEARRQLGWSPDAIYLGMMGWSGDADWSFEGLRRCMARYPRLRMACCGRDLSALIEKFPEVRDRVEFLGYLSDEKIRHFRCAIDLGLIPMAQTEFNVYRLPFKLTDYNAAGTPVLISAIGETGPFSQLLDQVFLCEPNLDDWLRAFEKAVARLHASEAPPRADTTRLFAELAWPAVAARFIDAYRAAIADGLGQREASA